MNLAESIMDHHLLTYQCGTHYQRVMQLLEREHHQIFVAGRPEVWWDPNGRMFGTPQRLTSGTATLDWWFHQAILSRVEYRYDHTNAERGFFYADAVDENGVSATASSGRFSDLSITG